jgi:hypothetical protein
MPNAHPLRTLPRKAASLAAVALALAVAAPVQAADNAAKTGWKDYPTQVRFEWKAEARTAIVTFQTGCRSAHGSAALEEAFEVYLDRDYLQFDIQGGYKVKPQDDPAGSDRSKVGPADCMGAMSRSIELRDVERETYVVNRQGYLFRNVTLGDEDLSFVIPAEGATKVEKPAMFMTAE